MKFSCIICAYNEGPRILPVLKSISKIELIDQIIVVDDGSIDNTSLLINDSFPNINLIRFEKNQGKTAAMRAGVNKAINDYIFLTDADLEHLIPEEIQSGLEKFNQSDTDMIIFQVFTTMAKLDGYLNKYITFSGTRILKKADLEVVLKENIIGYQLEAAINHYFMKNKKQVYYLKCSAINPNKLSKEGTLNGFINNIKMEFSIISYSGLVDHVKQILFFAKDELK